MAYSEKSPLRLFMGPLLFTELLSLDRERDRDLTCHVHLPPIMLQGLFNGPQQGHEHHTVISHHTQDMEPSERFLSSQPWFPCL